MAYQMHFKKILDFLECRHTKIGWKILMRNHFSNKRHFYVQLIVMQIKNRLQLWPAYPNDCLVLAFRSSSGQTMLKCHWKAKQKYISWLFYPLSGHITLHTFVVTRLEACDVIVIVDSLSHKHSLLKVASWPGDCLSTLAAQFHFT